MEVNGKRHNKPLKTAAAIIAGLLIVYIFAVNLLISAVLVPSFMEKLPAFERITKKSYAEQVQTTRLQENARALSAIGKGWAAGQNPEIVHITSRDGYQLAAAQFLNAAESAYDSDRGGQTASSHRWVILLHGYTGSRSMMYEYGYWYDRQGYNILVPDLRCQGESEGDYIGLGYTDSEDVMGWIAQILRTDPEAEIVLHGVSMGSSTALMAAGRGDVPANVRAVIADCAYTDAYEMFRYKIGDWFHLPAFPVIDTANLFIRLRAGYDLRDASPLKAVRNSHVPTLFIHGTDDRMIPRRMTDQLYEAAVCDKQILIVQGAGHAQSAAKDPVLYFGRVRAFLQDKVQ